MTPGQSIDLAIERLKDVGYEVECAFFWPTKFSILARQKVGNVTATKFGAVFDYGRMGEDGYVEATVKMMRGEARAMG